MLSCAVYGCRNNSQTSDASVEYYPFPKNIIAQQWMQACGWPSTATDFATALICSIHFDETAYNQEIKMVDFEACYTKTLRYDAVPTLYLPQTQLIIKDDPIELDNVKGVVIYTINSTVESNGITTISLQDEGGSAQFFNLQPSTSNIKIETVMEPLKKELDTAKYCHIKSYPDLYLLQAHNKSLKRKNELLESELKELERALKEKEDEYLQHEYAYKKLKAKIKDKSTFNPQEQKLLLSKVFSESQIKILFGKKRIYWSNDDMAVGYTIRHLSNKRCYMYLTKTLKIPLPAISSIKRWVTTKKPKKMEAVKEKEEILVGSE